MPDDPSQFLRKALVLGHLTPADRRRALDWIAAAEGPVDAASLLVERGLLSPAAADEIARALADEASLTRTTGGDDGSEAPSIGTLLDAEPAIDLGRPAAGPDRGPRFRLGGPLGQGGMAVVVEAYDRDLRREVAIKSLHEPDRTGHRRRFLEEAQVTGQLEHPNIVPVHELGCDPFDRRPFLVMKRVRGRDLRQVLEAVACGAPTGLGPEGPDADADEPPRRALRRLLEVFLKVCAGVAYAHSRGVVHRDLKPANVMTGPYGEVLVMDWGLARVRSRPDVGSPIETDATDAGGLRTHSGRVPGTPIYMAPEQARGEADRIDERTDVYGLGALLHQIVGLDRPVSGQTREEILRKVAAGEIEPVGAGGRAPWPIPRELVAVVDRAMAADPADRYPNAVALAADVEAFREERTLAAARYAPWQRVAKWVRRNRAAAIAVAATAGLVLVAVGALVADRARQATAEYEAGRSQLADADRTAPFDPAAPEDYFQPRLAALVAMGRAIERHPWPSEEWRTAVGADAAELQRRAEEEGDWALADGIVETAAALGVLDEAEREARLAAVADARQAAARRDADRLDDVLERIAAAEAGRQGSLEPGEVVERARRLAGRATAVQTRLVLARLADDGPDRPTGAGRRFLIELLGATGDATTTAALGLRAPDLARRALTAPDLDADLRAAWVRTAFRLALPDLEDLLARLADEASGPVGAAIAEGRARRRCVDGGAPLPPAASDPEGHRRLVAALAEGTVSRVESGLDYARHLLARLRRGDLGVGQTVFVFDQLGLLGITVAPDPARPDEDPVTVLLAAHDDLPRAWLGDRLPDAVDPDAWRARRRLAIAAAVNLSRLGADGVLRDLVLRLHASGYRSAYWEATRLAIALLPIDRWVADSADELLLRGVTRLLADDPSGALADLDRALATGDGASPGVEAEIQNGRGNALRRLGRLSEARTAFDRAIEIDPTRSSPWHNRAEVRQALGDAAGSLADLDRALALDPSDPAIWTLRAQIRRRLDDLDGAAGDLETALSREPAFAPALVERAALRFHAGDLTEAEADLDRAARVQPDDPRLHDLRGLCRLDAGDPAGAVEAHTRALRLDPTYTSAHLHRGNARRVAGDLAGAIADYDRALALDPTLADAAYNRARTRQDANDADGARADYDLALSIDPDHVHALANRAALRRAAGDEAGALADLDRAIERAPEEADLHFSRGSLLLDAGRAEAAAAAFERVLTLDRRRIDACHHLARARLAGGDAAGAVAAMTEAVERQPDDPDGYRGRSALLQMTGRLAEALADLDRAIELDGTHAKTLFHRANLRRAAGDVAGARADLDRVLTLEPDHGQALANRGLMRLLDRDVAGAVADLDRAVAVEPDNWRTWANHGLVWAAAGDRKKAGTSFDRAIEVAPPAEHERLRAMRLQYAGR